MYARGSLADQAFRSALALPPPEPVDLDSVAAELARSGILPADDLDTSFPVEFVGSWFELSGASVDAIALSQTAVQLHQANSSLRVGFGLTLDTLSLSFATRARSGVAEAVRNNLAEITSTATRLGVLLGELRGELLHQRLHRTRNLELESLHALLHESFHYGQTRAQMFQRGQTWPASQGFEWTAEVGAKATSARTWLEEGLACLVDVASGHGAHLSGRPDGKVDPAKPHRDTFIRSVAAAWTSATGLAATSTGRDDHLAAAKFSPFQKFHQAVCGHTCGLLVRDSKVTWEHATPAQREELKSHARRLGLAPVPSASSVKRALAGRSILPPPGEVKLKPD